MQTHTHTHHINSRFLPKKNAHTESVSHTHTMIFFFMPVLRNVYHKSKLTQSTPLGSLDLIISQHN